MSAPRWFGPLDGNTTFTAAYPEAKVVLNHRRDLDAWHRSATTTLMRSNGLWAIFLLSCPSRECFWAWHLYVRFMWPGLFRALDGNIETGMARNGKWVYRGELGTHPSFLHPPGETHCWRDMDII